MINITQGMSQSEILNIAHQQTAIPGMIILFVAFIILFLISGLFLIDYRRSDASKFILIWFVGTILSLAVLIVLCFNPDLIQSMANFFGGIK